MVTAGRDQRIRLGGISFAAACVVLIFGPSFAADNARGERTRAISILVLPLIGLSGQDSQDLGVNLSNEISLLLAQSEELAVVLPLPGVELQSLDVRDLGSIHEVEAAIEGSVRLRDEEMRVTIQAVRVSNGHHVWSQTYETMVADRGGLVTAIAQDIANALIKWGADT